MNLRLSNPSGGGFLGTRHTTVLRILDNGPTIAFTGRWIGAGPAVQRTGPANLTSRVDYAAIEGHRHRRRRLRARIGYADVWPGRHEPHHSDRLLRDVTAEGSEVFTMRLRRPVNARLRLTEREVVIADNDFGGTVQFGSATYSVREGANRTITVTRTGTELTVGYFTSNGSGIAGEHYVSASGACFLAWAKRAERSLSGR